MDGALTLIFANSKTTWDFVTKFSAFLQLKKMWILTNLKGVAQNLDPPHPLEVFYIFGGKSKFWAPQIGIKMIFKNNLYTYLGMNWKEKIFNFEFLNSG